MPNLNIANHECRSLLSLRPLILVLKKMIVEGKSGAKRLYEGILKEVEQHPELMEPMPELCISEHENELVETLLSTIFPPATSSSQGLYAVSFPFKSEIVFSSPMFKEVFLKNGSDVTKYLDDKTKQDISKATLRLVFDLILNKLYDHPLPLVANSVHPFTDDQGLTKYYEIRINAQFVDVKVINQDFVLPNNFAPQENLELDELEKIFPMENFQFEGFVVIEATDVTEEQVIIEIKNTLLNINSFNDVNVYEDLQQHLRSLMGITGLQIGITPFFKMNDYYLYTNSLYENSLLFKNENVLNNRNEISKLSKDTLINRDQPILYEELSESSTSQNRLLEYYYQLGARSLILCPLKKDDGSLIGILEIMSTQPGELQFHHLAKLQKSIGLFTLTLEKSGESLELQIDKMIKEHFTAIQAAVEWKFTEAAFDYLQHRQLSELAKMPSITFEQVHPLYAAIDVRNSSTQRNHSIQLDLMEQLNVARELLMKADKLIHFPILSETKFRIEKFIDSISETLLSDDELMIYDFLQNDLDDTFKNLRKAKPELRKWIDEYYSKLDPQRGVIYHHRKDYEESITRINDVLDRFIDTEQHEAQEIYPHYFERYITDGLEFNIYIGQSLSPQHPFSEMYVRNLKLWQLTLLAKAARITHALEKRLSLPLQTTQLILAHSLPLSISFRRKERKFDVDGAYNIRYEIIKKRIDKVHIKDTDERLTQPGKIAIVYSQQKEKEEYLDFIDFLQKEKLLGDAMEHLDLEDTQGISGLKAIRVDILVQSSESTTPKIELSKTTSKDLLSK